MLAAFHAAGLEAWDVNMYDPFTFSHSSRHIVIYILAPLHTSPLYISSHTLSHTLSLFLYHFLRYDLLNGRITLECFRGVVFCGGFSYADVNDSAKVHHT